MVLTCWEEDGGKPSWMFSFGCEELSCPFVVTSTWLLSYTFIPPMSLLPSSFDETVIVLFYYMFTMFCSDADSRVLFIRAYDDLSASLISMKVSRRFCILRSFCGSVPILSCSSF